jgi:hypothetical protein
MGVNATSQHKLATADVAVGSKADLRRRLAQVRFAPQSGRARGHLDTSVKCQQRSFDHLVGAGEQRRWDVEAKGLGSLR